MNAIEQLRKLVEAKALASDYSGEDAIQRGLEFTDLASSTDFAALLAEVEGLVRENQEQARKIHSLQCDVKGYQQLAERADRKNDQKTIHVDFTGDGINILLQAPSFVTEQAIGEVIANTMISLKEVARCVENAK